MRTRLRAEAGMGLVELLIAMTVLAVALLALVAAFSSGALTLQRAGQTSTAAALANQQMELYRGLKYDSIRLDAGSIPAVGDVYRSDTAYALTQVTTPACAGPPVECDASRPVTGPDNRSYRVDTYIVFETLTGPPAGRELKKVTVVVRDAESLTTRGLVRTSSKFDRISG